MTLSPIWTNCWPQTRPACGTTIRKHCRRNRDRRDFDHRLRIDPSAAARRATSECSENASATTCSKFEQSARSMDRDATGRSKNIPKECGALDEYGYGGARGVARMVTIFKRAGKTATG